MLHRDESVGINRLQVVGPDGENIGGVEAMYVDGTTNEPQFALVGLGFFRLRHSFVPMEGSRTEGDELHVRYGKDLVKDAPYLHPAERIDDGDASALYEHFGLAVPTREPEPEPPQQEAPQPAPAGRPEPQPAGTETAEPQPERTEWGATGVLEDEGRREGTAERPDLPGTRVERAEAPAATAAGGRDEDMTQPAARASGGRDAAAPAGTADRDAAAPAGTAEETGHDAEPAGDEDRSALEDRTVDELRQMASERDVPGRSSMRKDKLVEALSRDEGPSGDDRAYEDWTVDELRQLAADRDISGRSSMNKRQLIDALRKR